MELADKWDAFMSLGRTVRKSVYEEDNWQECLCCHHGGSLHFHLNPKKKQCSLKKKAVAFSERCFLTGFKFTQRPFFFFFKV